MSSLHRILEKSAANVAKPALYHLKGGYSHDELSLQFI